MSAFPEPGHFAAGMLKCDVTRRNECVMGRLIRSDIPAAGLFRLLCAKSRRSWAKVIATPNHGIEFCRACKWPPGQRSARNRASGILKGDRRNLEPAALPECLSAELGCTFERRQLSNKSNRIRTEILVRIASGRSRWLWIAVEALSCLGVRRDHWEWGRKTV